LDRSVWLERRCDGAKDLGEGVRALGQLSGWQREMGYFKDFQGRTSRKKKSALKIATES